VLVALLLQKQRKGKGLGMIGRVRPSAAAGKATVAMSRRGGVGMGRDVGLAAVTRGHGGEQGAGPRS
jgi:hypothetical protein